MDHTGRQRIPAMQDTMQRITEQFPAPFLPESPTAIPAIAGSNRASM